MSLHARLLCALALLALPTISTAQSLTEIKGIGGWYVGDLDGDGIAEFAAPTIPNNSASPTNFFDLYGNTYSPKFVLAGLLASVTAPPWHVTTGLGCAIADYTGDGVKEIVMAGTASPALVVYDGVSHSILLSAPSYTNGHEPYSADVDGDGVAEFLLIGSTDVYVYKYAGGPSSIPDPAKGPRAPSGVTITHVRPNPTTSRSTTRIDLSLSAAAIVTIRFFDSTGRLIRTQAVGRQFAGPCSVQWDGRDDAGRNVPSGTYTCLIAADEVLVTRQIVIAR